MSLPRPSCTDTPRSGSVVSKSSVIPVSQHSDAMLSVLLCTRSVRDIWAGPFEKSHCLVRSPATTARSKSASYRVAAGTYSSSAGSARYTQIGIPC